VGVVEVECVTSSGNFDILFEILDYYALYLIRSKCNGFCYSGI
jgi:hypothetical protein